MQQNNAAEEENLIENTVQPLVHVACSYGSINQAQQETLKQNMTALVFRYRQRFKNQDGVVGNVAGDDNEEENLEGEDAYNEHEEENGNENDEVNNSAEEIGIAREEVILNGF